MLLSVAACAKPQENREDDTSENTTAAENQTEAETGRANVKDGLDETYDYKGRPFRTLIQDTYASDIWVEKGDTGDIVSDAVYTRNLSVQDRLGIIIEQCIDGDYNTVSTHIKSSFKAGTYDYDLVMQHMIQAGNDALGGCFYDWYKVPNVDFTREWYPSFAIEGLTVNGHMLIAVGDMLLATIDRTYCIFYDKVAAANHGITDIDELTLNYEWTIDKMTEIMTLDGIYENPNNNKVADYYAFGNDCVNAYSVYYYCFDLDRVQINSDYEVVMDLNGHNGKTGDAIEKLKLLMLNDGVYCWTGNGMTDPLDMFMDGKMMFCGDIVGSALKTVRTYENDYGILPYPMYDTAQKNYYTIMGGGVSTMEIVNAGISDSDVEFIGTVTEAMCSETWRSVIPQYYDVALKYKGTRSEESVKILDILLGARAVDVSIAYDGWNGMTYKLKEYIHQNKNWSSSYAKSEKTVSKHYQKIAKIYAQLQ